MRRVVLSAISAGLFAWLGFYWFWTNAERLPEPLMWMTLAPFAPGLGVAALATRLGMDDPDYLKYWLLFYGVNLLVWTAVFYGLATLYVRRKERRRGAEPPPLGGPSAGGP